VVRVKAEDIVTGDEMEQLLAPARPGPYRGVQPPGEQS
jgi:hypothetical protein